MDPYSLAGAQTKRGEANGRDSSLVKRELRAKTGLKGEKGGIWNLDHDSPDEEDWEVQSNEVEVPFRGIEFRRMPPRVTSRVGVLSLDISNEQEEEERAQKSKFSIFNFRFFGKRQNNLHRM